MILYIKVGSVTNAQRGASILKSHGYKARVKRLENPSKEDGCGYMIELEADNPQPLKILENNSIPIKGVDKK